MRVLFFSSFLLFFLAGRMSAQVSFEAAEPYLLQSNVQGYLSPAVDALSATMQSSSIDYFYPDSSKKFNIYVGVYAAMAFIPTTMKTFDATTTSPFSPARTIEVPTIFGENKNQTIYDAKGNAFTIPGGFDINRVNLAFPILHVGKFFHTNFSGRYIALDVGGDFERIETFGFGLNHFISDYWKAKNYNVSVGAGYNQIKLGPHLKGQDFMLQVSAGQKIKKFNYWGYVQYQQAAYDFYYKQQEGSDIGSVTINSGSRVRFGVGCGILLWKFYIHTDASGLKPLVANLGIGMRF